MYSKLVFATKRLCSRFPVILGTLLLLLVVGTTLYFDVRPTPIFSQQSRTSWHPTIDSVAENRSQTTTTADWIQEKKALEEKLNGCRVGSKEMAALLETEKEIHRKVTATCVEKQKSYHQQMIQQKNETERLIRNLNQDKAILQANVTIHREFFRYASSMLRDTPYPGADNYTRYTVARLGMTPLAGIEPLRPEYGPVINDVTSFRYPISVPACGTRAAIGRPSVFVAVVSAAGNADKRNRIRQTWRTHLDVDYHKSSMVVAGFAFVLGLTGDQATQSKIEQESREHGDVIQIEMSDFYRNLSLKVAGLFNWLHTNCLDGLDFLFKVDDDVYVNVRNLAHFVQSHNRSEQSIFGNSAVNLFPARDGKWGVTVDEWPWKDYPRYFYGPGVLFPGGTIIPFLAAFQTTPFHPVDDLYYSGIGSERAGVKVRWSTRSTSVMAMGQPAVPAACDLRRFISWLTVSASHMNSSHFATQDFYHNRTQCVVAGTNGNETTVDYLAPIQFDFN